MRQASPQNLTFNIPASCKKFSGVRVSPQEDMLVQKCSISSLRKEGMGKSLAIHPHTKLNNTHKNWTTLSASDEVASSSCRISLPWRRLACTQMLSVLTLSPCMVSSCPPWSRVRGAFMRIAWTEWFLSLGELEFTWWSSPKTIKWKTIKHDWRQDQFILMTRFWWKDGSWSPSKTYSHLEQAHLWRLCEPNLWIKIFQGRWRIGHYIRDVKKKQLNRVR